MSMSPESEGFEQLRRLIALKRHEQPPPGYFHHFSREVIVRIKAGDTGDPVRAAWWSWEDSWLQRAWTAIETRPVIAGAFGVAVCGFFAAGALLSDTADASIAAADSVASLGSGPFAAKDTISSSSSSIGWAHAVSANLNSSGSLEGLTASQPSLFNELQPYQR